MDREEIIQQIRVMDREQLEKVKQFLDRLPDRPENQKDDQEPDPEADGSD